MRSRNIRLMLVLLLAAALINLGLGLCDPGAFAVVSIPQPASVFYVLDEAGILSPQVEGQIVSISRDLEAKTKAQVVVVTLKDSRERPLEDLGLEILRGWGIGDKQLNNGVLMLVIHDERKSRIEVGYGLEGVLPDGKTGRIQDEYMLPYFTQGNYDQGVLNGYLALAQEVAGEYGVALNTGGQQPVQPSQPTGEKLSTWEIVLIILGIVLLFFIDRHFFGGFIFAMLLSMMFRGGGRGGGFGGGGFGGGGSGGGGGSSRGW